MMRLFLAPPSDYSNHFEQSKFKFTWNIYILLLVVFAVLSIVHIINADPNFITTVIAFSHCIVLLIILKVTRKYVQVAILTGIFGFFINQFNIYAVVNPERFIDMLWIFVVSFYLFYMLGSKWGILSLVVNFIGLLLYIFLIPDSEIIKTIQNRTTIDEIVLVINSVASIFVISFLLHRIILSSKIAEKRYVETNKRLKQQNKKVVSQNNEKTVLLREIHHRVKNNLQVISSLLRLQVKEFDDEKIIEPFNEAINRVASMALIHEKMYQTEDMAKIDLKEYLKSLINEIIYSYSDKEAIDVNIDSEINQINLKALVPLALIFNELSTNSFKHGFKDMKTGEISISITNGNEGIITINYRDNGKWKEPSEETSFGVMLIDTFTEQLEGSYTLDINESGTNYTFTFRDIL